MLMDYSCDLDVVLLTSDSVWFYPIMNVLINNGIYMVIRSQTHTASFHLQRAFGDFDDQSVLNQHSIG